MKARSRKRKQKKKKTRAPILAAGGIVLRGGHPPLFAVVQLRKNKDWVLPKGKLGRNENARAAARREVLEETGHSVSVHEFLGSMAYDVGGKPKIVQFWRMQAGDEQVHDLMADVKAVQWLPLAAAVAKLSQAREREFLRATGPVALKTARSEAVKPVKKQPAREPPAEARAAPRQPAAENALTRIRNWLRG